MCFFVLFVFVVLECVCVLWCDVELVHLSYRVCCLVMMMLMMMIQVHVAMASLRSCGAPHAFHHVG
jgi:hypothetical protein